MLDLIALPPPPTSPTPLGPTTSTHGLCRIRMVDHTPPCVYLLFVCIDIHASHWLTWPTYFSYSLVASRIVDPLHTVVEVETGL